jgi:signal peptidase I
MEERALTFREFLNDIRSVVTSPARRFAVIHSRGSVWGSLLLLVIPVYCGFGFVGGIYFDRDPFPGYSFALPALLAFAVALGKVYFVHVCGRVFVSNGREFRAGGKYREILAVFGYTTLPSLFAMLLALTLFTFLPSQIGGFLRDFRIMASSVLIAIGVALFIWNLILVVLALRLVYPMRDYQIVLAFLLGSALIVVPAFAIRWFVIPAQVAAEYVRPLLNDRVLRFLDTDDDSNAAPSRKTMLSLEVDRLRYRVRSPERYDLATYDLPSEGGARGGEARDRSGFFSLRDQAMGRVVGMPGEIVELARGVLLVNGQVLEEPYLAAEYRSEASYPATRLSESQYFILPENRKLLDARTSHLIVNAAQVSGRAILNKWPFGWWLHRPSAYKRPNTKIVIDVP